MTHSPWNRVCHACRFSRQKTYPHVLEDKASLAFFRFPCAVCGVELSWPSLSSFPYQMSAEAIEYLREGPRGLLGRPRFPWRPHPPAGGLSWR